MEGGRIERLFKNSAIYGIGNVLGRMLSFFLLPLFTSFLTTYEYGLLAMLNMFSVFLQPIFALGTNTGIGILYFEQESKDWQSSIISSSLTLLTIGATIMVVLVILFIKPIGILLFDNTDHSILVLLSLLTLAAHLLESPLAQKCQLDQKATPYIIITLISTVVTLGSTVTFVIALNWHAMGYILGGFVGSIIRLCIFATYSAPNILPLKVSKTQIISLMKISIPMIPSTVSAFILAQSSKYLLQVFNGLDDVGIYSVALSLGGTISIVTGAFTSAWSPFFLSYTNRQEDAKKLFGRITTYYVYGIGLLCLQFFIFAKFVVMLMTDAAYISAYYTVGFCALAQWLYGLSGLLMPAIYYSKKTSFLFILQLIAGIIGIAAGLIFVPSFGVMGAGISNAIGYFAVLVLLYLWNKSHKDCFQIEYEPKRLLIYFLFLFFIASITMRQSVSENGIQFVVSIALSICSCIGTFILLSHDERTKIIAMIRRLLLHSKVSPLSRHENGKS